MGVELTGEVAKLKVTDETLLWLRVEAAETGKSHHEIAREVLHQHAVAARAAVHRKHRLYRSFDISEGSGGELPGKT